MSDALVVGIALLFLMLFFGIGFAVALSAARREVRWLSERLDRHLHDHASPEKDVVNAWQAPVDRRKPEPSPSYRCTYCAFTTTGSAAYSTLVAHSLMAHGARNEADREVVP